MLQNFQLLQQLPLNISRLEMLQLPGQNSQQDLLVIWHTNKDGIQQRDVFDWQGHDQSFKYNPGKLRYNAVFIYLII